MQNFAILQEGMQNWNSHHCNCRSANMQSAQRHKDTCTDAAHLHHEPWLIRIMCCSSLKIVAVLDAFKTKEAFIPS